MNAERLTFLASLFNKLAFSLVKTATAVCKQCGEPNEYLDPDPNFVCRQCKMRAQMYGGKEEEKPKDKPIRTRQPAHTSAPYSLFDRLTRYQESLNTIGTDIHYKDAPSGDTHKLTMTVEMTFLTHEQRMEQFNKFAKVITEAIPTKISGAVQPFHAHAWKYGKDITIELHLRNSGNMILIVEFPTGKYEEPTKVASCATKIQTKYGQANEAYEAGFKDGTFDIANDQWGSAAESWSAFVSHHERQKDTYPMKPWMYDLKSYKQGYNDAAFTSEKGQEINKGFWNLPGGEIAPEHSKKHHPHHEKGETSFEGLLEDAPRQHRM